MTATPVSRQLPPGIDARDAIRLPLVFAAYPDALLVVDAAGLIVLANPPAAQLLGYGPDELVGLNVDELVPDSIRPRHAAYRGATDRRRARGPWARRWTWWRAARRQRW
jgi:PAS domain S-box-containing protein